MPLTDSPASTQVWPGEWVERVLDVHLHSGSSADGAPLTSLVGLAVRRNPRRAHLLVSRVLGKHVPTDPDVVHDGGRRLGALVAQALDAYRLTRLEVRPDRGRVVVLGYAETATALGHIVADVLDAPYLHSTRRRVEQVVPLGGFEESHSHAADHLLLPVDPQLLSALEGDGPLVLVDDEISTGSTALQTIAALQQTHPRAHYVLASLVDLRSLADRERMTAETASLGAAVDVVALATGSIDLPPDVLARGERVVTAQESICASPPPRGGLTGDVVRVVPRAAAWGPDVKEGGRHGFLPGDRAVLQAAVTALAGEVATACGPGRRVHVLGFEELMYAPLRLAQALALELAGPDGAVVTSSTTTSSPILVVDDPGYPVRSALTFPAHDDPAGGPATRYAYNVSAPASDPADRFDVVVLVVDTRGDGPELTAPGGLVPQLARAADRVVLVVLPQHDPVGVPA